MAAPHSAINRQLFQELKRQYPEIPDYIVTGFMIQYSNNKNKCLEVLAVESPKHMFGEYSGEASGLSVVQQLADLNLMDPQSVRQRSDSGSSLKSNASTGSLPCLGSGLVASLANAWPPTTINNPAAGASQSTIDATTSVKTTKSPDFSPYLQHSKSTGQIPNIECTTKVASVNRPMSQGSPVSNAQNAPIHHISAYTVPVVSSTGTGTVPPQPAPKWTSSQAAYISHLNSNMYSAGQLSKETEGHSAGAGQPGLPDGSVSTPQHLSEATIFIQGLRKQPQDRNINQSTMPKVAIQPQFQIQQPPASHQGSRIPVHHFISTQDQSSQQQQDAHVAASANQSNNVLGVYQLGPVDSVASPPSVTTPPFVLHCNYGSRVPQQLQVSVSPVSPPVTGAFSTPTNPPSLVYKPIFYPPDIPVRGDIMPSTGVPTATVSYPAQTTLNMPNYQTFVTTLPHMSNNKAGSPAREDITPAGNFYNNNNSASVYPASVLNMSSTDSSESSRREDHPRRPSSQHEEREYIKALLSHQRVRKEKLDSDLQRETKKLEQIQGQVTQMEKNMAESNESFPTVEALFKLRDSNRKLLTEIQCMTREIDMFNQGRTPLGNWNAQDEQFFQHLEQGRPPAPLPNLGMSGHTRMPNPTSGVPPPTHMPGHTPHQSTQTLPPKRTQKPLPSVPPPVPNITRIIPPAPQPQPQSSSGDSEEGEQWSCTACTFLNHPALNKCECCEMPRVHLGSH